MEYLGFSAARPVTCLEQPEALIDSTKRSSIVHVASSMNPHIGRSISESIAAFHRTEPFVTGNENWPIATPLPIHSSSSHSEQVPAAHFRGRPKTGELATGAGFVFVQIHPTSRRSFRSSGQNLSLSTHA